MGENVWLVKITLGKGGTAMECFINDGKKSELKWDEIISLYFTGSVLR